MNSHSTRRYHDSDYAVTTKERVHWGKRIIQVKPPIRS